MKQELRDLARALHSAADEAEMLLAAVDRGECDLPTPVVDMLTDSIRDLRSELSAAACAALEQHAYTGRQKEIE